jgi:hypothetical protein
LPALSNLWLTRFMSSRVMEKITPKKIASETNVQEGHGVV